MDAEKEFAFPKAIARILDTVETRAAWSIFNDQKTPEEKAKDEELKKRRKFKPYSPESEIKKICEELRSKGAEKEAEHLENEYQARLKRGTDFGIANKTNFEYFLTEEGHKSYTPYGARSIVLDSKIKAVDTENQTATTISSTISDSNSTTLDTVTQHKKDFFSENMLNEIKDHTAELLPRFLSPAHKGGFICPNCGNGSGDDGTGVNLINGNSHVVSCRVCNQSYNIFQIAQKVEGIKFYEAVKRCADILGMSVGNSAPHLKTTTQIKSNVKKKQSAPSKDFTDYYIRCHAALVDAKNTIAMEYLKSRSLDDIELIKKYQIGYDEIKRCIIIPHDKTFFTTRKITNDKSERFTCNPAGTHVTLFNSEILSSQNNIFVVEGAIDALSLIKAGFQAVAVGGVGNFKTLIRALENIEARPKFIILFDSDKAGEDNSKKLQDALIKIKIFSTNETLPMIEGNQADANDWLKYNPQQLKEIIAQKISTVQENFKNWTPPMNATGKSEITNIDDKTFINLFKERKYKEAEQLAEATLKKFIDDNNFSIRTINQYPVMYSASICKNSDNLEIQGLYEEFRAKCKDTRGVLLVGDSGLDAKIKKCFEKLNEIKQNFIDREIEKRLQNNQELIKKKVESGVITAPLPLDKVKLPSELFLDTDNNATLEIDRNGNTHTKFDSINLITKRLNNIDTNEQKIEVATLKSNSNQWNYAVDKREIFASNQKILLLATAGLDVISRTAPSMVDYLHEFENLNYELIPTIKTVSQTGWRGDDFVYPNTDGNYQLDDSIKSQLDKIFTVKGNKSAIIPLIKKIKEIDVSNASLGAMLAAPLVNVLNIDNIVLHIFGLAGSGKTALNTFLFSFFGNPKATGAIPNANATQSGLEYHFAGRHDLPAFIEDLNSVSEHDKKFNSIVKQLPYQFGNRNGRLRATPKGGLRNLIDFRGSLLTNDEKPLTTDTSAGGGKRRVIELKCDNEMFSPDLVSELYEAIEDNFGLFGREWIEIIKENKAEMIEHYKTFRKRTKKAYPYKVPRHIQMIAAFVTANTFFDTKILGMDFEQSEKNERNCAGHILDQLPDNEQIADFERAKPIIKDWILQHYNKFINDSEYDGNSPQYNETKSFEIFGIIKKDFVAVNTKVFKEMLTTNDFSPDIVIRQLIDDGFLIRDGDRLEKNVRIKGFDKQLRFTAILKSKLEE